jgi:hypothetical protein
MSPGQTVIDHELLTTDGRRVAGFGWYAGGKLPLDRLTIAVGVGEALVLTGLGLLKRGRATPLLVGPRGSADSASCSTLYLCDHARLQRRASEGGQGV